MHLAAYVKVWIVGHECTAVETLGNMNSRARQRSRQRVADILHREVGDIFAAATFEVATEQKRNCKKHLMSSGEI